MQPVIAIDPIVETRGDDWIWPFTLVDDNEAPLDLSGCAFDGAAIRWRGGMLALDADSGRLTVDATAGAITVTVARDDTMTVPEGQRAHCVLPIVDTLNRKATLLIIPLQVVAP